jgi:hypothetical protein
MDMPYDDQIDQQCGDMGMNSPGPDYERLPAPPQDYQCPPQSFFHRKYKSKEKTEFKDEYGVKHKRKTKVKEEYYGPIPPPRYDYGEQTNNSPSCRPETERQSAPEQIENCPPGPTREQPQQELEENDFED